MDLILVLIPLFSLIIVANLLEGNQKGHRFLAGFLFMIHLLALLASFAFWTVPEDLVAMLPVNPQLLALPLLVAGLWGMASSTGWLRRQVAGLIPLKPASPVHTLALVYAGYLVAYAVLLLQGGLEVLSETAEPANIITLVIQSLFLILLGLLGVGLFIRRDWSQVQQRLGLARPTADQLITGVGWIIILVFLQGIAGYIWAQLDPERASLVEDVNVALLQNFDTVWHWFLLAMSAAVGEEILFRGAVQPAFGIWLTAALFAVIHVQYGFSPITTVVFVIGVILGYIRQRHNTTMALFIHFGYNFVLGLLSLLAPYLEQMSNGG